MDKLAAFDAPTMQTANVRPAEIHGVLDNLEGEVDILTDSVAILEDRLSPVLNRSEPVNPNIGPDRASCNTAIGERIQQYSDRVEKARILLQTLTTQLEV